MVCIGLKTAATHNSEIYPSTGMNLQQLFITGSLVYIPQSKTSALLNRRSDAWSFVDLK